MPHEQGVLEPATRAFYCQALSELGAAGVPVLVGGAYAFARYTGIERHTKDFDIFVRPADAERTLAVFQRLGYRAEITFPHWIGKVHCGEDFVDVIFRSGNGVSTVDDDWFIHAPSDSVFDLPVKLVPAEELILMKAFIQERERFDGADVAHLLLAQAEQLDWSRLLARFDGYWQVLLAHLTLFAFIYPSERARVPTWVMRELLNRMEEEVASEPPAARICRGTLLSRQQYLVDVDEWGYVDERHHPDNVMTPGDIALWTAAIKVDGTR